MADHEENLPNRGAALAGETKDNNLVFDHYFGIAERTELESSYVGDTFFAPYNPDDLYQKTGDHSIYEEMAKDDQVSVCLQLKKDLIIGSGWDMVSHDEGTAELADKYTGYLQEDPTCALDDYLDQLVDTGQTYGFGLAEKVFRKRPNNDLTLRSLKTRHPDSWLIYTDKHGNVNRYSSLGGTGDIDIEPKAIMAYIPTRSNVGPYGMSDLRKVYSAYFTKRHITRFYSIFLEGVAKPIPVAKYPQNLPDAKVTELHNIIKKFQASTSLTIPKEIEIEFLEAKSNGEAFIKGINIFNMFIGRGLFVPDLLGFAGSESQSGGSQALGREQVDMFLKHIARRRNSLERLVNREIVQPMIIHNEGFMDNFPKFQFKPLTEEDTKEYARIFIEAVKGKFYSPTEEEVNHFRGLIKFPEGDVDLISSGSAGGGLIPPGFPGGGPAFSPGTEESAHPKKEEEIEIELDEDGKLKEKNAIHKEKNSKHKEKDEFVFKGDAFLDTEGDFGKAVDFQNLQNTLESDQAAILAEARPLIEDIFEDFKRQIQRKNVLKNPSRQNELKLKSLGKLNALIQRNFRTQFKRHGDIAQAELFKTEFAQTIASDEFLELLDNETFQYVGDFEFNVTKEARVAMSTAIRDGLPISSVVDIVDDDIKKNAIVSLERYSRTKGTEIMNRARVERFEDSRVVDAYQYSALIDGSTTEICAGLHGKIFKKGTEPIPPLHFNCRSTLIPITIFQDFEISTNAGGTVQVRDPDDRRKTKPRTIKEQPIDKFIEDNKGKGFSRR